VMVQGFSHVAFSVRRLDAAIDFYVRILGFTLSWRNEETAYLGGGAASIARNCFAGRANSLLATGDAAFQLDILLRSGQT
jgi:catechol 2,3-dioxygenase-like lactoylglutathione lyase family enzyme